MRWRSGGASAFQSVDLEVHFPNRVISKKDLKKKGIHSFPARRSAYRGSVENKPASSLVVSVAKALSGMPPSSCGKQVAGPSSLPVVVAQYDERHANQA